MSLTGVRCPSRASGFYNAGSKLATGEQLELGDYLAFAAPSGAAGRAIVSKFGKGFVAPVNAVDGIVIDVYGKLIRRTDVAGQAHHLNQHAAFRFVIAHADGVSVKLRGNAFSEVGSPHYNAHESMESFWDIFRRGGMDAGNLPTNSQYNRALYNSLQESGLSPTESLKAVQAAKRQQLDVGLRGRDLVPRLPGRINQTPR